MPLLSQETSWFKAAWIELPRYLGGSSQWLLLWICKAILLVALLPVSLESESEGETTEIASQQVWLDSRERSWSVTPSPRGNLVCLGRLTKRSMTSVERNAHSPQFAGHRWANGLLAPLKC